MIFILSHKNYRGVIKMRLRAKISEKYYNAYKVEYGEQYITKDKIDIPYYFRAKNDTYINDDTGSG
jgi:hypothetical protein